MSEHKERSRLLSQADKDKDNKTASLESKLTGVTSELKQVREELGQQKREAEKSWLDKQEIGKEKVALKDKLGIVEKELETLKKNATSKEGDLAQKVASLGSENEKMKKDLQEEEKKASQYLKERNEAQSQREILKRELESEREKQSENSQQAEKLKEAN